MDWDFPSSYCTTTLHLTIPTPQRTPCAWTWIVARTIVITGANSFLAIPDVQHLLAKHTKHALLLTVRNTSDTDVHTRRLHGLRKQYPDADFSIRELDLNKLSAVHDFATTIVAEIDDGKLVPLASIVCNAYYWNLAREVEFTTDSYEKTFQVTYVAHAALVLRLLGSFGPSGGRVVLFSSYAHWSGKNLLEKYPPAIPTNLQSLVKPAADDPPDNFGRGFQRYAVSKLAVVMWMYVLNRRLEKDPKLGNITAIAINSGNLSDSRALRTNTPRMLVFMSMFIIQPSRFLLQSMDPTMRTAAKAGVDVADLATNKAHPGERGYFTLLKEDARAPDSTDEKAQQKLWIQSMEWARITRKDIALTVAFG